MPHINGSLIVRLQSVLGRLAVGGWSDYFNNFGLNITATGTELAKELTKSLNTTSIYTQPEFKDLVPNIQRAIERGDPARSFLYHAFASPAVTPENITEYPSLADLEVIENYIYVATNHAEIDAKGIISPPSLADIQRQFPHANMAVVVFAQEYRQGDASVHRKHADMSFSRTGVARVGTTAALYDKKIRGFSPVVNTAEAINQIRVLPAQYGAYISVLLKPGRSDTFGPLGLSDITRVTGDRERAFWVPVHKLFSGDECLKDNTSQPLSLSVAYEAHHVNQKIKQFHQFLAKHQINAGFLQQARQGNLNGEPFLITAGLAGLSAAQEDSNGLLVPVAQPLVKRSDVSFNIPPKTDRAGKITIGLYASSLLVQKPEANGPRYRPAPEYLHIRDDVNGDLNDNRLLNRTILLDTNRKAHHYTDATADGWITAQITGLEGLSILPAYSLITAPDFYPGVNQYNLQRWTAKRNSQWQTPPVEFIYPEGGPDALSQERLFANLKLFHNDGRRVFGVQNGEDTITALVTLAGNRGGLTQARVSWQTFGFDDEEAQDVLLPQVLRHQGLPDAAAGIFAPGWDVTIDHDDVSNKDHFAAYGLGSPFPEDAKLCAALSAFWPAASPDVTRTFMMDTDIMGDEERNGRRTTVPMTNAEIGGGLPGDDHQRSWDGVTGPRVSRNNNQYSLTSPNFFFADYTLNARDGRFSLADTSQVSTADYLLRMKAMHAARGYILENSQQVGGQLNIDFKLISFEIDATNDKYYFHFGTLGERTAGTGTNGHKFFNQALTSPFSLIVNTANARHLSVAYHAQLVRPPVMTQPAVHV